jgi:hypothetical protein
MIVRRNNQLGEFIQRGKLVAREKLQRRTTSKTALDASRSRDRSRRSNLDQLAACQLVLICHL